MPPPKLIVITLIPYSNLLSLQYSIPAATLETVQPPPELQTLTATILAVFATPFILPLAATIPDT